MRKTKRRPLLVGIAGGSGAGKSWLAERLQTGLGSQATRFSLDEFYRDRSYLPPGRRDKLNFDHPACIAWPELERVLRRLQSGHAARLPCYDFVTHCRMPNTTLVRPKPFILVDGLWLFRRPSLRKFFALRIYVDCPARIRMNRRLARDVEARGLSRAANKRIFLAMVEPMHRKFVAPQQRWADIVLEPGWGAEDVRGLLRLLRSYPAQPAGKIQPARAKRLLTTTLMEDRRGRPVGPTAERRAKASKRPAAASRPSSHRKENPRR